MYKHICKNCGKEYQNNKGKSSYCSKECQYKHFLKKKIIDLKGQKFGRLTVLSLKETNKKNYKIDKYSKKVYREKDNIYTTHKDFSFRKFFYNYNIQWKYSFFVRMV